MLSASSEFVIGVCYLWASILSVAGLFCWRTLMSVSLDLSFYTVQTSLGKLSRFPAFRNKPGGHIYRNQIKKRLVVWVFRMQMLSPFLLALSLKFCLMSSASGSLHFFQSRAGGGEGVYGFWSSFFAQLIFPPPTSKGFCWEHRAAFQALMPCELRIQLSQIC